MDLTEALVDWDDPDDADGNVSHVARHGFSPDEIEHVLFDKKTTFDVSDSSGRPIAFGDSGTGHFIAVVFELLNQANPLIVRPVTAYEVPQPRD